MAKRLVAKTGEFTNNQNEIKGEYTRIGVCMQGNEGGEYMLLDPTVSLAGVLAKQNTYALSQGKPMRDSVMVSVFDDANQQQNNQSNQQHNNQGNGQQYQTRNQPNPRGSQNQQNWQQNDPNF